MTKASRKGIPPLAILRIDGPMSIQDLSDATGISWCECANICFSLHAYGRVSVSPENLWDCTEEGDRLFRAWCDRSREMERDAACRGVA